MALPNNVTLVDLVRTLAARHPHLLSIARFLFGSFRWISALFALFYFGALIFMTIWTRTHTMRNPAPIPPEPRPHYTSKADADADAGVITATNQNVYQQAMMDWDARKMQYDIDVKKYELQYKIETDIFKMWIGEKDLFVQGVKYLTAYLLLAVVILPILDQVDNL